MGSNRLYGGRGFRIAVGTIIILVILMTQGTAGGSSGMDEGGVDGRRGVGWV